MSPCAWQRLALGAGRQLEVRSGARIPCLRPWLGCTQVTLLLRDALVERDEARRVLQRAERRCDDFEARVVRLERDLAGALRHWGGAHGWGDAWPALMCVAGIRRG